MVTTIPFVTVEHDQVSGEYRIACTACGFEASFVYRATADVQAIDHQRRHTPRRQS